MASYPRFAYEEFEQLNGLELSDYMEPLLCRPVKLTSADINRLVADLKRFVDDEYHLAYALQLGVNSAPEVFIPLLPKYLTHESTGVACTAHNALNNVDAEYATDELIESIASVAKKHPRCELASRTLESLRVRRRQRTG